MELQTPNYAFGKAMQASAPPGVICRPGFQATFGKDHPDAPAIVLLAIKEPEPTELTKRRFVDWLLNETSKDARCKIYDYGEEVAKDRAAIEAVYDLMLERRPDLNNL